MHKKYKLEVCFSPAIFHEFENPESIVVIVDILRATSAICTAFMNGVKRIIPVASLEEAQNFKNKGYMVAAERDGIVRDFADFGNSPYNFTPERISGKEIVYSTTNGTNCIMAAKNNFRVLIGSYLNITALADYIMSQKRDLIILCAGWKNKFNLEDTIYSGALSEMILSHREFYTICDSTVASLDIWGIAKPDLMGYVEKIAQRHRLRKNKLDDVIGYCHTFDQTKIIPALKNNYLVRLEEL